MRAREPTQSRVQKGLGKTHGNPGELDKYCDWMCLVRSSLMPTQSQKEVPRVSRAKWRPQESTRRADPDEQAGWKEVGRTPPMPV